MIEQYKGNRYTVNAYQIAKKGMYFCGDSYYITAADDYFLCVLADGLGSGEHAHEASQAVITAVQNVVNEDVSALISKCNEALKNKRGAAVSILKVNYRKEEVEYCSVGNIRFFLYPPSEKLIYPLPVKGYLSGKPQSFKIHRFPFEKNMKFFLFSDGINIPSVKSYIKSVPSADSLSEIVNKFSSTGMDDVTLIAGEMI
ncbi:MULTISPECIES: PP2C family serine/threonine-protein phosphatase [Bacillus]|uniref:PP2C family serine/threonine-protein phosphatase n=1 Tax=Bacillus TaxID=1386 RepID=UPI000BB8B2BC|nr:MULTISPECIES: PP2C family serine/threonine-protein phosphatase [Bacillus]